MSTTSAFMGIPQPAADDPFADGDDIMRALVDRIDYLLGESGDNSIVPSAASTKTTKVIAFGRTYKTPPRVVASLGRDNFGLTISAGVASLWVDDVTTTDFTIAVHSSNTTQRDFTWIAKPKRTDVTP